MPETATRKTAAPRFSFFLFLLVLPMMASAACDPSGSYLRGASGPYGSSFDVSHSGDDYTLQLDTYGQKLADGTLTSGAIRGNLELSQTGCAAAYLAPEEECAIFIVFNRGGAELHQFGNCSFGAGASAGGHYRRLSKGGLP
jgi:hypothetical protein